MNYGYNLAAAGILTAMHRQDVASNNLANVETIGFKPDRAFTIPRQAARIEDRLFDMPSNKLLERLGAGVLLGPSRTTFDQGSLRRTGNPLDVGIEGDGFLTLAGNSGGAGEGGQVRLTRDGRLTMDAEGRLVTVAGGLPVLDDAGRPITLSGSEKVEIDGDGTIYQGGTVVARMNVVSVPNRAMLRKVGHNQFVPTAAGVVSDVAPRGRIVQGHVEDSAVDAIKAMMDVQSASGAVAASSRLLSMHDELTGRMISSLGRVSA